MLQQLWRRISFGFLVVALVVACFGSWAPVGAQEQQADQAVGQPQPELGQWRWGAPPTTNKDGSEYTPPPATKIPPEEIPPLVKKTPSPTAPPVQEEEVPPVSEQPAPQQPVVVVKALPVTGATGSGSDSSIVLILGAAGLMLLAGRFAWRGRLR